MMFGFEIIRSEKLDKLYANLDEARESLEETNKRLKKEKEALSDIRDRQGESVDELVRMLSKETANANDKMRMLLSSEDARKSLAEKNKKLSIENGALKAKVELLERQLENEQALNKELKTMYDDLSASHEMVIKGLHDATVEVC